MAKGTRRKTGVSRHPNGRIVQEAPGKPEFLLARRRALVGKGNETNPAASRAIGILKLSKEITEAQCLAAERFESDWRRWASLAGAPPHEAQCGERGGVSKPDPSAETWARAKEAYEAASLVIRECHQGKLVWSLIETVVMDNVIPLTWTVLGSVIIPDLPSKALKRGLDALMQHYRIKEPRAA